MPDLLLSLLMVLFLCIDHFVPLQFDMQQLSLDELKQVLFHAFRDHLTMKDIENIIITEEESLNETSGNCPEYEG
ncbi:Calcium-binding protein 8, partial [Goodea atripinnis]